MMRLPLSLAMLLALGAAEAPAADEPVKQPFELVRELQTFQDEAVLKTGTGRAEQKARIARVAAQLIEFDNKAWLDPRNARAAVIYVLSGGDPRVLRKLTGVGGETGIDERLIKGALAYGERRDAEAAKLLEGVDVDLLDRGIGGHVALVRALLLAESDPRRAFALLDRARLAAPGTIVEEAALRRQAIVAAKLEDLDAFEALSSQYFRRFASSIFMRSFERQFAEVVVSGGYGADAKRMAKLATLLRELPEVERRETCLALAEQGIGVANLEIVRLAARTASINAKTNPQDAMRLVLFEAAALIASPDYEQGRMALRLVDRSKLGAREEALLHAALAVAEAIGRPPSFGAAPAPEKGDSAASGVISEAQGAIARVDGLLSETAR
jgi:chemotaxis protein MotC